MKYECERLSQHLLPPDLREAEQVLEGLAKVFLIAPGNQSPAVADMDKVETAAGLEKAKADVQVRYQVLVEQIPAVVFMAFLEERISEAYVSPQIETLLGFTQKEWLEDPVRWYRQVHTDDKARWSIEIAEMLLSGKPLQSAYRVLARDGRVVWFQCEAKMVRRGDGRPWFVHGVAMDITELKQSEEALRKMHAELETRVQERTAQLASVNRELRGEIAQRERAEQEREQLLSREHAARSQAEEANRLKDQFLATVSHELRNPLNAILGWARMLRSGMLDAGTTARAVEVIERNALAQNQLIGDLLDVSRIITGKLRLDVRPVDLPDVIQAAVDSLQPAADAKGVRLQLVLDPRAGPISGDPDRLQQVVWNLLSNAVKFTPREGRIQVRLERINSHVEITVSDTGIGIDPQFLPYVFDRFRQADGTTTRVHGGLGLGMAIVRQLLELHGGSAHVYSAGKGQGTTFTVKLPLMVMQDGERFPAETGSRWHPTAMTDAPFECPPALKGLRVLVVDDEADARALLTTVLGTCGAMVQAAASATEALDALELSRPDILISDIEMPGEDGYSLIVRLRARERETGGWLPAAALTAHARTEDRLRALAAGFQMHLAKPIEPAELLATVASLASFKLVKPRGQPN